jgi:hypothetical protein
MIDRREICENFRTNQKQQMVKSIVRRAVVNTTHPPPYRRLQKNLTLVCAREIITSAYPFPFKRRVSIANMILSHFPKVS